MKRYFRIFLVGLMLIIIFVWYAESLQNKEEYKTLHFTLIYPKNIDSIRINKLSQTLEHNYLRLDSLYTNPENNITANIYSSKWRYVLTTGNIGATGSIEGTSKLHFVQNEPFNDKIAIHEFMHTVFLKLLLENESQPLDTIKFDEKFSTYPVWLWEAVSVFEAGEFYDPNTLAYFQNGKYPELTELNTRSKGQKIYTCGYTIIEYILKEFGREKLIQLIKSYGDVQGVFNVSEKKFSKNWYGFVNKKYME